MAPPVPRAPAPPPLPYVDPDRIRPTRRWYWLAGGIIAAGTLLGGVLAVLNAITEIEDPGTFHLSIESYAASLGGGGIGSVIGAVTWSRRTEHRRRLQREALQAQGQA